MADGLPIDSALILRAESNLTATATTTAIDVEGGSDAELHIMWGLPTGTSPTLRVALETSVDGGSTYQVQAESRSHTATSAPATGMNRFHDSLPVYIPKNTQTDTYGGALRRTRVRITSTLGGTSPVYPNMMAWLAPPDTGSTRAREA